MRKVDMAHAERLFDRAEFWKMMKIALPAALQQSVGIRGKCVCPGGDEQLWSSGNGGLYGGQ